MCLVHYKQPIHRIFNTFHKLRFEIYVIYNISLFQLEYLNLGGNQLTDIHNKAFTKLINLRVLYLDNNLLESIPSDAFKPLTNLQQLFLGGPGNSIHTIKDDAFRYLYR